MKKLLGIIVLGLLLGSKVYSDDVIGTKIVCAERWLQGTEISTSKLPIDGYDFISKNKVIAYQMSDPGTGFYTNKKKYKLYYNEIEIKNSKGFYYNIDRTTGIRRANKLSGTDVLCKPIPSNKNMKKIFQNIHKMRLKSLKQKQKF